MLYLLRRRKRKGKIRADFCQQNVNAQLLTVPVYIFGAIVFLVMAYFSDKYRTRSPFIIFGFSMILIGYIILATVDAVGGRYFSLFLSLAGCTTSPVSTSSGISNNTAGECLIESDKSSNANAL